MALNPEQAWHLVLGPPQIETPRTTFEIRACDTRLVTNEDIETAGVRNLYARDWLGFHKWKTKFPVVNRISNCVVQGTPGDRWL